MSMAISSLKRYGANISTHTKNWRPQILLLNKLDRENTEVKYPQLLSKYSETQNKPNRRVFAFNNTLWLVQRDEVLVLTLLYQISVHHSYSGMYI